MRSYECDQVDDRFVSATEWEMSDLEIMKENGVYDELVTQEPLSVYHDGSDLMGGKTEASIRSDIINQRLSIIIRDRLAQKVWIRPTIQWSL